MQTLHPHTTKSMVIKIWIIILATNSLNAQTVYMCILHRRCGIYKNAQVWLPGGEMCVNMILYINKIVWCFCIAHTAVVHSALKRQINRRMDGWTNKETDLFYLSCCRLFPLLGGSSVWSAGGKRFSESYHSVCDIRLQGPPAKHPPETSSASVLTRHEITGLLGYCERGGTFQSIPIFVCVFKPFSTSESSHHV